MHKIFIIVTRHVSSAAADSQMGQEKPAASVSGVADLMPPREHIRRRACAPRPPTSGPSGQSLGKAHKIVTRAKKQS